jgi:hypothetical protein
VIFGRRRPKDRTVRDAVDNARSWAGRSAPTLGPSGPSIGSHSPHYKQSWSLATYGLLCMILLADALQALRDTVTVVPNVIVNIPPSPLWPTLVTLGVLFFQSIVLYRQHTTMKRQADISEEQQRLAQQQAAWRRSESIGTFYRAAFELIGELRKADVLPLSQIPADYSTHPRQILREASRLFSPLGNDFLGHINDAALYLDQYFSQVHTFNESGGGNKDAWGNLQEARERVGEKLDLANGLIPPEDRWQDIQGRDFSFQELCQLSPPLRRAVE